MDVSVIFATYNRADILKDVFEAWKEVDKATKYSYEIICSDDDSTDGTVEIIKGIKGLPITILKNKKGGASKARNAALKIAKGKVIIFTGDDIFPTPNFINIHYENYLKFGENVATLGRIDWHKGIELNHLMKHITEIGCEQFGFIGLPVYQFIDFRHFYTSNISVSAALLSSLDKFFDTDFDKYGFEDIEFGYRLQKNGMKIYYDPEALAYHHHVYNSIYKFCERQISAGEELVVFNQMHDDLEDKCICDVENCSQSFEKFLDKKKISEIWTGKILLLAIELAKKVTVLLEKRLKRKKRTIYEVICSAIYSGVFKLSFFYGVAKRIALKKGKTVSDSQLILFVTRYLKKPYHEIYWNTGEGFNERDARKWICWDASETLLECKLPEQVEEIRIAPLKDYCQVEIMSIEFVLKNGKIQNAEIDWHNACRQKDQWFDFSHTNDPMVLIRNVPENYKTIRVKMKVNAMCKKNRFFKMVRHKVGRVLRRILNNEKNKELQGIEYAYGQRRRIQIGVVCGTNLKACEEWIQRCNDQIQILGEDVAISKANYMLPGYINYFYAPKQDLFDITQILQVVYTLLNEPLDYVLVSKSYKEFPTIACKDIYDVLVYNTQILPAEDLSGLQFAKGRYMRLPGYSQENSYVDLQAINPNIILNSNFLLGTNYADFRISKRCLGSVKFSKPVIFVIPVFFAVGGVERNTVEIMEQLKERYEFCLITLERHMEQQGSLHYQLNGICKYIFDLREITEQEFFLKVLFELKQIFAPQLLWFCNNSPWLERNFGQIRSVFDDVSIVMQDVYDTKMGWIEYYDSPDIRKADRYIAVTELIKDTFIKEYNLPEEKIDVIYSVVNDSKIEQARKRPLAYEKICEKYGLDSTKEHYAYVGRLTEQKDPLRYLKLVNQLSQRFSDKIQFVMVGDGLLRNIVDSYIEEKNISNLVCIPYVANTPELIGIMDGLVITSKYEGLPIVSIEAMGMGTPIFSTDSGDTKRFLRKNESGLIIDEKKSDYENFQEFRENIKYYKKNSQIHSEEMIEFFSAHNISNKYLATFTKAIEGSKQQ